MAIQLCRQMKLERFGKGQAILKQGDESNDKLYIILSGSVAIVYQKDTNIFRSNSVVFTSTQNESKRQSMVEGDIMISPEELQSIIDSYGSQVNQLGVGDGFGEKALLLSPSEARRNASIVALQESKCITMIKKDFVRVMENFNKEYQAKEQLLFTLMPFLKLITSSSTREALIHYFKNDFVSKGRCLTREGKEGSFVYVLVSGKVFVEKSFENENNIYYSDQKFLKVSELSEPMFIGEEILFPGVLVTQKEQQNYVATITSSSSPLCEKYRYTIKADSQLCKFFAIPKSVFLNKFPKDILADLLEKYLEKEAIRAKVFDQMKQHWLSHHLANADTNVKPIVHQLNSISNQEIFKQMKPSMIDNHNRAIFNSVEFQKTPSKSPRQSMQLNSLEPITEDFNIDFRVQQQQYNEEKQRKKILLQQQMKSIPKDILKKRHSKFLTSTSKPTTDHNKSNEDSLFKSTSSVVHTRPQTSHQKRQIISTSSAKTNLQLLTARVPSPRPTSHHSQQSAHFSQDNLKSSSQSALDRLKMNKNRDGSLDTVELISKVRFQKINIDDVTFADIMGENFNIYDNVEANRQFPIRPESGANNNSNNNNDNNSRKQRDFFDSEEEKERDKYIKQSNAQAPSLDLGYLNDFKKILHYKLVTLGKNKGSQSDRKERPVFAQQQNSSQFSERVKSALFRKKQSDSKKHQDTETGVFVQTLQTESDYMSIRSLQSKRSIIPSCSTESNIAYEHKGNQHQRQIFSAVQSRKSSSNACKKLVQSKSLGISIESTGILATTSASGSPLSCATPQSNKAGVIDYPYSFDSMKLSEFEETPKQQAINSSEKRISFSQQSNDDNVSIFSKSIQFPSADKQCLSSPRSRLGVLKKSTSQEMQKSDLKQIESELLLKALSFERQKKDIISFEGDKGKQRQRQSSNSKSQGNLKTQGKKDRSPFDFNSFLWNKQQQNMKLRFKGSKKTHEFIQSLQIKCNSPRETNSNANFNFNNFLYSAQ